VVVRARKRRGWRATAYGVHADSVLRAPMARRIVQAMRLQWNRGMVGSREKRGRVDSG
jgi:hypothetical protein